MGICPRHHVNAPEQRCDHDDNLPTAHGWEVQSDNASGVVPRDFEVLGSVGSNAISEASARLAPVRCRHGAEEIVEYLADFFASALADSASAARPVGVARGKSQPVRWSRVSVVIAENRAAMR